MKDDFQENPLLIRRLDSLADGTRLRLLRILERQELGVMELCEVLILPQSTVSRHLKVLADSGWLQCYRKGVTNLYGFSGAARTGEFLRVWQPVRDQCESWPAARQDKERLDGLLIRKRKESQRFFGKAAESWDQLRDEMYGKDLTRLTLLSLLPSDWVVADLGCGTGGVAAELSPFVRKIVGVDQSADMLRLARRRLEGAAHVEFRRGRLEDIPIEAEECHAALLRLVLSYVPQPAKVIAEAARILKPGGRLVILDLGEHAREDFRKRMGQLWLGFRTEEIGRLLQEAGLEEFRLVPLPLEQGAKGPPLFIAGAEKPAATGTGFRKK